MKIHLVAICGTGMGSLAGLLKTAGHDVRGSDKAFYPPMSERLQAWGIPALQGFDAKHIDPDTDMVIVGNACRKDNPEAIAAQEKGLIIKSFPQALSELFISQKRSVVIAGTHGKTTTSSLLSFLLVEAQRDPSFLVGGILQNYGKSFRLGKGPEFIVEGDEYDSAFFDKRPKFLHYQPNIAVLTSVEFDHADIYDDMHAYRSAYRSFVDLLPRDGLLVACIDDHEVSNLLPGANCQVIKYGLTDEADWQAQAMVPSRDGVVFELVVDKKPAGKVRIPLGGDHNVANTLATLVVANQLGLAPPESAALLAGFSGVARRMQVRGISSGVTVIDDFAHHPTEVRSTVQAVRNSYPDANLVAVFEPRTNTSRRKFFQDEYPDSFGGADRVVIVPPFNSSQIPEADLFDSAKLADDLVKRGQAAVCLTAVDQVVKDLTKSVPAGGVILVMSNGAFDNIHEKLLSGLKEREGTRK
ncbi:MAG: UDP-N-acetylmuramate:L-alanyl-gamma-D-glutamyl-meso-diaminopimelate ligase [Deltaproteobacteria bacterium]|nr:UDP-N-acetylmuramate:L-alanyl-gamma-D-glutamyl-meso-diaminopimelate ligase [Deltaproteobacteria bacterium]